MTLLSVPDMSCAHCKASVTTALTALADAGSITVDLDHGQVVVSGAAPAAQLIAALDAIGFPATLISQD